MKAKKRAEHAPARFNGRCFLAGELHLHMRRKRRCSPAASPLDELCSDAGKTSRGHMWNCW